MSQDTTTQIDDGLRGRLLGAICRCLGDDPADADPGEVDDLMGHLIPEVRAYADQRAAEELRSIGRAGLAAEPGVAPVRIPVSYLFERADAIARASSLAAREKEAE